MSGGDISQNGKNGGALRRGRDGGARRVAISAGVVLAVAGLAALGGVMMRWQAQAGREAALEQRLAGGNPATVAAGHVKLVVYEREGCRHCLEFEEEILPRLEAALGGKLEVERREAALDMQSPTIVVMGKENRVFEGLPDYSELEQAVRETAKE